MMDVILGYEQECSQQVEGSDSFSVSGSSGTAAGALCPVLSSLVPDRH